MRFDFTSKCAQRVTIEANQPEAVAMRVLDAIHKAAEIGRSRVHVLIPEPVAHDLGVALAEAGYGVDECAFTSAPEMFGLMVKW